MTDCFVYRLCPRSPFHFGEKGVGLEASEEIFRSDSLFSAIVSALRELYGTAAVEMLLASFQDERTEPPFLISSCFPFVGDVLLLPRPFLKPNLPREPEIGRQIKKVRYVSLDIWRRLVDGSSLASELCRENLFQDGAVWLSSSEVSQLSQQGIYNDSSLWTKQVVPRVTLDRQTSASELYACGRVAYSDSCGLFFLAKFADQSYRALFEASVRALADSGIGGERSSGCGLFSLNVSSVSLSHPAEDSASAFVTLSCYKPTLPELQRGVLNPPASYDLLDRFGWICSPEGKALRRKDVSMIVEGSVLPGPMQPRGQLADVTPDDFKEHKVYRYGLAFPLPVKIT